MTTLELRTRIHTRWSISEDNLLLNAILDESVTSISEMATIAAELTGRTPGACMARAYYKYRPEIKSNFVSYNKREKDITLVDETTEKLEEMQNIEVVEHVAKEISYDLFEANENYQKDNLDSRTIFDLYEKLNAFKELVESLQQENKALRMYHDLSEREIERLRNELVETHLEKSRTIEHIKSIQTLISHLSDSAFSNPTTEQNSDEMKVAL